MPNLKEIFEKDKRGTQYDASFVEQVDETTAIHSYYGMGDVHEGVFSYDEKEGWKFVRYYDRSYEKLSDKEKAQMWKDLAKGLKQNGFTEMKEDKDGITFTRKEK